MLRYLFPLFGCVLMMAVCMAVMSMAGHRKDTQPDERDEVAALREEVARLRGRLDRDSGAAPKGGAD